MDHCLDLYLLSAAACQLSECLCKEEVEVLAASFKALGEMLELNLAHKNQKGCQKQEEH